MRLVERERGDNVHGGRYIRYNSDTLITDDTFRKTIVGIGGHVYNTCCSYISECDEQMPHSGARLNFTDEVKRIFNGGTWLRFGGPNESACEKLMTDFCKAYEALIAD